jgi:hypothetical protein
MVVEHLSWILKDCEFLLQLENEKCLLLYFLFGIETVLAGSIFNEDITQVVHAFGFMECLHLLVVCLEQHQHIVFLETHKTLQVAVDVFNFLEELRQVADKVGCLG